MKKEKLIDKLKNIAFETGFTEVGELNINELEYETEVRKICESNQCGKYGSSWVCPPATGTLEECKKRVEQYDHMLLLNGKFDLEDSFDFEGMIAGMHEFKKRIENFDRKLKGMVDSYLILGNEGCSRCEKCTYPDAPCRFPEKLYQTVEGYGFNVSKMAASAGMKYNNGQNTITYFGALLFCDQDHE